MEKQCSNTKEISDTQHNFSTKEKVGINVYLKLRNLEPGIRKETWHREEGEGKEETCIYYLKILTSGIPERVKKQQRNSTAASSDTDRPNAAITWPQKFGDWYRALEIGQLESCNLARIVIFEHLLRKKVNLA